MQVKAHLGKAAAVLAVLLVVSGCETAQTTTATEASGVTQAEFSALKAEVADLRSALNSVRQEARDAAARADAAEQAAQRAAADARAAAEKADRIYAKSLQK
jgi:murein lipoprotein